MSEESQEKEEWINGLSNENFLAVYDVVLDIKNEMQLTDKPAIPLWQSRIKFPVLMPMDSIGHRDHYCEMRWKAVEFLKKKRVINDFEYLEGNHRWESKIAINADEKEINEIVEIFEKLYKKRETKDEGGDEDQSIEIQAGDKLPLAPPEKVTIPWLLMHVPVMLWIAFFGLLLASYSFGVKTSHIPLIRDLYGLEKFKITEEGASPVRKPNKRL